MVGPAAKREVVDHFSKDFALSERRSCVLAGQNRSVQRYKSVRVKIPGLLDRLLMHAAERPRFGYKRITTMLPRDGFPVNHKRIYRMYKEENLTVRRKRRRRASQAPRAVLPTAAALNDCWSMDFLSDSLNDGRTVRVFAALDDFSRLCTSMEFDVALPAERVTRILDRAIEKHGKPKRIRTDNGPEFTSKAFDAWAYKHGIEHHFIQPGKPQENAFAESLNSRIRDELLNQHCFSSIRHARDLGADWREDYNAIRPHTSLGDLSPEMFLAESAGSRGSQQTLQHPTSPQSQPIGRRPEARIF